MMLHELEAVVLKTDLPRAGLRRGDLGTVVHVHDARKVEVEFMRASGHTQALVTVGTGDIRPADDGDVIASRRSRVKKR